MWEPAVIAQKDSTPCSYHLTTASIKSIRQNKYWWWYNQGWKWVGWPRIYGSLGSLFQRVSGSHLQTKLFGCDIKWNSLQSLPPMDGLVVLVLDVRSSVHSECCFHIWHKLSIVWLPFQYLHLFKAGSYTHKVWALHFSISNALWIVLKYPFFLKQAQLNDLPWTRDCQQCRFHVEHSNNHVYVKEHC